MILVVADTGPIHYLHVIGRLERDGRRAALALGLHIRGTLGILEDAEEKQLLNLSEALGALRQTTFRAEAALFEAALQRDRDRRSGV